MACPTCDKPRPSAAYIRVSTPDQAKRGYSIPEQREQARRKALELGYCADCLVVYEDVHTGSEMERPAFDRLREAIRQGRHDTVICLCPDRLGRDTVGMLLAYEELKAYGVRVEYVQIHVDDDTPEGRLFLQISAVFSDYERRKIVSRIRAGKERKVKDAGRLPHHVRLYGYTFNPRTDLLEVDPEEAAVVRQIFAWAAGGEGGSLSLNAGQICRRLEEAGIPRSDGGRRWYPSTVLRMLRREVYYTGELITHRWADRARRIQRPPERQYGVKVPPLVDEGTWRRANENLDARRAGRGNAPVPYPLRGVIRCGRCGRPMYGKSTRSRGKLFRYYYCPGKRSGAHGGPAAPCPQRWWNADRLEGAVWNALRPWLRVCRDDMAAALQEAAGSCRRIKERLERERESLRGRLQGLEQKLAGAIRDALEEVVGKEELQQALAPLREEKARLSRRLRRLEDELDACRQGEDAEDGPSRQARVDHLLARYEAVIADPPHWVRDRALATFVEKVTCEIDGRVLVEIPGFPRGSPH